MNVLLCVWRASLVFVVFILLLIDTISIIDT